MTQQESCQMKLVDGGVIDDHKFRDLADIEGHLLQQCTRCGVIRKVCTVLHMDELDYKVLVQKREASQ